MNRLVRGDCLRAMRGMEARSVDLIYLDPPFNSGRDYSLADASSSGFGDVWRLDDERRRAIRRLPRRMRESGLAAEAIEFLRLWMRALSRTRPAALAYVSYMLERVLEMRRVLSSTGSIYLHCDSSASHDLKAMMDGVFGAENFRNEIVWAYEKPRSAKKVWRRNHDVLLFYTASDSWTFHPQRVPTSDGKFELRPPFRRPDGTVWRPKARGKQAGSWWSDIPSFATRMTAKERNGYPTQKPLALLERVIAASSSEGDVVLDPFCGSGTTLEAAHRLKRRWIGIDVSAEAIEGVARSRLETRSSLVVGRDFRVEVASRRRRRSGATTSCNWGRRTP